MVTCQHYFILYPGLKGDRGENTGPPGKFSKTFSIQLYMPKGMVHLAIWVKIRDTLDFRPSESMHRTMDS